MNFGDWRRTLKIWAPPLIGIPGMLLLGNWFDAARYILFAHHVFWMVGGVLLINPLSETFWPSSKSGTKEQPSPQPSAKAQARAKARELIAKRKPATSSEAPAERLARLHKEKEAVDQKIKKLTAHDKERVK